MRHIIPSLSKYGTELHVTRIKPKRAEQNTSGAKVYIQDVIYIKYAHLSDVVLMYL